MAVRRLHTEQPEGFAFSKDNLAWAKQQIAKYPKGRHASAIIPLLWKAQEQHDNWLPEPAIRYVADMLDMPYIRALEIATFYTMFQLSPVGRKAHIQLCGTTPCMLRGAEELKEVCKRRIAPSPHTLSVDGDFSWEEVECLGACVNAPMVQIFSDTFEDLTPESFEAVLDGFAKGDPPLPGPQIDRITSAPMGGLTSLTGDAGTGKKKAPAKPAAKARAKPAAKKPAKSTPKPTNAAKPKAAQRAEVAATPSLDDKNRPAALAAARDGGPDDLKLISGVGPKLEGVLHGLGIFHFDQIAKWKKAERDWVDGYLKFKGRIERDDWVKQAKALAKGGAAEYEKVFGKKPR
jgi:NADH-quinone oxidoreductase subunit E